MDHRELYQILERFPERRMMVLGDVILDRYWWGEATRLSPEAPVPVVRKQRSSLRPGGAANTAANLAALGAKVDLFGVTGADSESLELKAVLRESGVTPEFLLEESERPTTTKTRIVALHQQIVRVDHEDTRPISDASTARTIEFAQERMRNTSGVVISDYAKGFLTLPLLKQIIAMANEMGKPVFIDPKGRDFTQYSGATLLKPNRTELSVLTGLPTRDHAETLIAGRELAAKMPETRLLVTEGQDGMTLFSASAPPEHQACPPLQVYDVTGAGDTVLATLALSICVGASYTHAMQLATNAASIAVGLVGTAAVTWSDLGAQMNREEAPV